MDLFEELRKLHERELNEMSRVGKIDGYEVWIRTDDPGNIPHMHIWDISTKGQKFHTCVRLDSAKYFHHTGKEDSLNSKMKKELNAFLKSNNQHFNMTNWEYVLRLWNANNSDIEVDESQPMQDYNKL